jgi:carbonic anhydrase
MYVTAHEKCIITSLAKPTLAKGELMCSRCYTSESKQTPRMPRRFMLHLSVASLIGLTLRNAAAAKDTEPPPKPQNVLSPEAALRRLLAGNTRYVRGSSGPHDFKHEREALAAGQNPFAAVLGCADSRIAPEYAFDTARGDLFVCRVAGNFASEECIASLEYAVSVLATPLILVLGHDACGAVDATIKSLKDGTTLPGLLPSLVNAIAPSVKAVSTQAGNPLDNAIRQNVIDNVAKLKSTAPILDVAVEQQKLKVVGGIYRLRDGRVEMVA